MQVILKEDLENLGKSGEVVNVRTGYGRNYLLPRGLAVPATAGDIARVRRAQVSLGRAELRPEVATVHHAEARAGRGAHRAGARVGRAKVLRCRHGRQVTLSSLLPQEGFELRE